MPQLSQLDLVYLSQWFWLLLVLAIIYFFVGKGIVSKVEETVDERDARISADLAEAERLRDEADRVEDEWRAKVNAAHADAQGVIAEAKTKAAAASDKRLAAADKRFAKKADEAAAELDAARSSALAEIEHVAAEAASDIVTKLTGANVSQAEARAAVAGALNHA